MHKRDYICPLFKKRQRAQIYSKWHLIRLKVPKNIIDQNTTSTMIWWCWTKDNDLSPEYKWRHHLRDLANTASWPRQNVGYGSDSDSRNRFPRTSHISAPGRAARSDLTARARTSRRASADARSDGRKISEIHSANATISDNEIFRASPLLCTVLSRSWQLWSLGYSVTEKHRRFGKCGWKVFEIHSLWCSCQNTSRVWSADQPVKGNWIATVWKDLEELTFKVELWGKPARSLFKCHLHSSLLSWKLRIFNVPRGNVAK